MKTLLRSLAVLAATVSFAFGSEGWMTNWEEAKAKAKAENKPILINLTGSDWCGWCIKLDKEVFSKKEFKDYAKENLVLVELDFPQGKRQSKKLQEQNEKLTGLIAKAKAK